VVCRIGSGRYPARRTAHRLLIGASKPGRLRTGGGWCDEIISAIWRRHVATRREVDPARHAGHRKAAARGHPGRRRDRSWQAPTGPRSVRVCAHSHPAPTAGNL